MPARKLRLVAVAALLLAACGGGAADQGGSVDTSDTTKTTQSGEQASGDDSDNYALVTIGEDAIEIPPDPLNVCTNRDNLIFGSFALGADGAIVQAGGTEVVVQVNFGIPVPDWEAEDLQPPNITVDDREAGTRWIASVDSGSGSVDNWELTDGRAIGTATFVVQDQTGAEAGTETGTFEVVCT